MSKKEVKITAAGDTLSAKVDLANPQNSTVTDDKSLPTVGLVVPTSVSSDFLQVVATTSSPSTSIEGEYLVATNEYLVTPKTQIDPILRAFMDDGLVVDKPLNNEKHITPEGRINWEALFDKEYFVYPNNDQTRKPLLKVDGLRNLAEVRGVESKEVVFQAVSDTLVVVSVKMRFKPNVDDPNGRVWSAVADATPANVGGKGFSKYLATIAETRATGRCIREALGIRLCTVEEVCKDDLEYDESEDKPIAPETMVAIKKQMSLKGVKESTFMDKVHEKYSNISSMNQLTAKQGRMFLTYLNNLENKKAEAIQ